jgi:hypothetical protein
VSQLAQTRPRSATEIIDASFRFYRAHFSDLLVLSALLLVPPALMSVVVPDAFLQLITLANRWMYLFSQGAIAILVAAALERGQALSAGDVFRELGRRLVTLIGVSIATGMLIVIGFVLLIIPGIIFLSWTMVAVPAAAIEGLKTSPAIERSRALARGRMGHILGTMLLVWFIVLLLAFGSAIALGVLVAMVGFIPQSLADMLGQLVLVPLFPLVGIAVTLLYYDLRVRSEGADVEAMIDALPVAPTESA